VKVVRLLAIASILLTGAVPLGHQSATTTKPVPVVSRVATKDRVVFITIDDGFTRSAAASAALERLQWPVTSFVLPRALAADVPYFKDLGSRTEFANHTVNHPNLTRLSEKGQRNEICGARKRLTGLVGAHTTFFRPPGGAFNTTTRKAAAACGMTHLLMWRVTVWGDNISTWGGDIKAGDVILLHYVQSLSQSIRTLEAELRRLGLKPALLSDYLKR
jgi:peptidoglycan/xylan/chitin deacetylase (PgdA/CDA1 family)